MEQSQLLPASTTRARPRCEGHRQAKLTGYYGHGGRIQCRGRTRTPARCFASKSNACTQESSRTEVHDSETIDHECPSFIRRCSNCISSHAGGAGTHRAIRRAVDRREIAFLATQLGEMTVIEQSIVKRFSLTDMRFRRV